MRGVTFCERKAIWIAALAAVGCTALLVSISNVPGVAQMDEKISISIGARLSSAAIPIAVVKGNQFGFTLASNATTGYKWRMASRLNSVIVKSKGSTYNAPSSSGLVGQPGTETWTFQAVGKGKQTIKMEYVRPWEKNTPPVKTQTFAVIVQ
ncbi:MAG: protease inhibitor I42 family protein [Armatimonadetes bacterium]|nr:protease inhibitor I42 family protein [Armatimonadota bacterium]